MVAPLSALYLPVFLFYYAEYTRFARANDVAISVNGLRYLFGCRQQNSRFSRDALEGRRIRGFHAASSERTGGILFERFEGASSIDKPHAHDFFVLLLFEEAEGSHWIDFIDYPVKAREAHLLFPGQIHKWNLGNGTKGIKLIVDMRLFETFSPSLLFSFARYIRDHVVYFPLAGASHVDNFRSPDAYVFILFEQCKGAHTVDFVTFEEKDRQVHISFPGQIHSWNTLAGAFGHKLIVSKYFMEKFLFDTHFIQSKVNRFPVIDITADTCRKLAEEFRKLANELAAPEVAWRMVSLRTQLIGMTIHLLIDDNIPGKLSPVLHRFHTAIDDHFLREKTVTFYARLLNVTPNYLNILCKQQTGYTAKEVIHQRFLPEAKRMLLGSGLSIKEIAYTLKFPDTPSFSRFIKMKTGLNPQKLQGNGQV